MDIEVFQKSHLFEVFEKLQNVNLFIGRVIFRQIYFLYSKETCVNLYYSLYYYYITTTAATIILWVSLSEARSLGPEVQGGPTFNSEESTNIL